MADQPETPPPPISPEDRVTLALSAHAALTEENNALLRQLVEEAKETNSLLQDHLRWQLLLAPDSLVKQLRKRGVQQSVRILADAAVSIALDEISTAISEREEDGDDEPGEPAAASAPDGDKPNGPRLAPVN